MLVRTAATRLISGVQLPKGEKGLKYVQLGIAHAVQAVVALLARRSALRALRQAAMCAALKVASVRRGWRHGWRTSCGCCPRSS